MGCDFAQGFRLGRPMPPGRFLDWLDRGGQEARPVPPVQFIIPPRRVAA
jgi:hypothetical protein